jgi:hypothetical protein
VLDLIYQIIVLRWVYPVQTLIVATTLALVPYPVVRGITNRMLSRVHRKSPSDKKGISWNGPSGSSENGPGA